MHVEKQNLLFKYFSDTLAAIISQAKRTGRYDQVCAHARLFSTFRGFLWIFYVLYSTMLHLPPLRFNCVGDCWDRTQDCCDFVICRQTP
jgi:hypothetical protein